MVMRIVLVRFEAPHRDDATRRDVVAAAREVFPEIPGVTDFEAGVAEDPNEWDIVLVVHFASLDDVGPYRTDPLHVRFLERELKPRMERLEACNFH